MSGMYNETVVNVRIRTHVREIYCFPLPVQFYFINSVFCTELGKILQILLRAVTLPVGYSYPLPLITEILDALGKARYYITADLDSGLDQVPLREEDGAKPAFHTQDGHFLFCTMSMGVTGAPPTFAQMMNDIMLTKALVYLDDIVVPGAT
jgi:hypothetical protein